MILSKSARVSAAVVIVLVAVVLVGVTSTAQAQTTSTPTPTITAQVVPNGFSTPTPYNTPSSYTCPAGLPAGYGTVTPSVLWLYTCGQCVAGLTSTAIASYTPPPPTSNAMTATAQAMTGTPTATITPTSTPAQETITYTTKLITYRGGDSPSVGTTGYGGSLNCTPLTNGGLSCSGGFSWQDISQYSDYAVDIVFTSSQPVKMYWKAAGVIDLGAYGTFPNASTWQVNAGYYSGYNDYYGALIDGQLHATTGSDDKTLEFIFNGGGVNNTNNLTINYIYISPDSSFAPVPTPIPNTSFCATVSDANDTGFGYSGWQLGALACLDLGPLDWSSILPSWMSGASLPSLPWLMHICFQNLSLGNVEIFGANYSLDIPAYVLGVAAFLFILLRK
jgi:hypothetical protein